MSKIGYATYIRHRLSGFEVGDVPRATPADLDAYPRFRDRLAQAGGSARYLRPICRGPIAYEHREPLERDLARLAAAIDGRPRGGAFMNAAVAGDHRPLPAQRVLPDARRLPRRDRRGDEGRVRGDRGRRLRLQIDAPDLAMGRHIMYRDEPDEVFVGRSSATSRCWTTRSRNIPADRVRLHLCWGNYEGPHHLDVGVENHRRRC